jgi:hypothetical protein
MKINGLKCKVFLNKDLAGLAELAELAELGKTGTEGLRAALFTDELSGIFRLPIVFNSLHVLEVDSGSAKGGEVDIYFSGGGNAEKQGAREQGREGAEGRVG